MAAERLPTCKYCDRKFTPDARNRDRQKVCGRPECRQAAAREKKRRYYRRRLEREPGFRETERARCRKAMRISRLKAAREQRAGPEPPPPCPHELLVGLVSQLGGTSDPAEVAAMMSVYADRGRRLTAATSVRGSPG